MVSKSSIDEMRPTASYEQLRRLLDESPFAKVLVDGDGYILVASAAALKVLDLPPESDVSGLVLWTLLSSERAWDGLRPAVAHSIRTGQDIVLVTQLAGRWLECFVRPVPSDQLGCTASIYIHDITDIRATDLRLETSEMRLQSLMQSVDGIIWEATAEPIAFTYVSPRAETLFGHPAEEWLGGRDLWMSLIHPDDRDRTVAECVAATRRGEDHSLDYRMLAANGSELWIHDIVKVLLDSDGRPERLVGIMVDWTERRQHEMFDRVLVEAIERSADMVFATDEQGRIRTFNPAVVDQTGYQPEEILGRTPRLFKSGLEKLAVYVDLWGAITTGKVWQGKLWNRRKDGSLYHEHKTIAPIMGPQGVISGYVSIGRDVTQQEELEARLRERQRIEAVGQLAGGIAHDFNNILQVILSSIEFASELAEEGGPGIAEELSEAKRAAARAARLTRQLLAFSRRQVLELTPISLNDVVDSLGTMLRRLLKENIQLVFDVANAVPDVMGDLAQLEQVLLNLCLNARDAMPQGGELRLKTEVRKIDNGEDVAPGEYVALSVQDTGIGMSESVRGRIFEPFFSTKQSGEGSGLGLAMSFGIVSQHGGRILATSEEGVGSTFTILIPVCHCEGEEQIERTSTQGDRFRGSEMILVAEDDGSIRNLVTKALEGRGYRVIAAIDGNEALELYSEHRAGLSLAILDLVMPGMGGTLVSNRIRKVDPCFPIVFCSGYGEELGTFELDDAMAVVAKPFDMNLLAERVRVLLDRPR